MTRYLPALLALLLLPALANAAPLAFTRLDQASMSYSSAADDVPSPDGWTPVSLPFAGDPSQTTGAFWFRIDLDAVPAAHRGALYVPHHVFDIELYLNGHSIAGTTRPDGRESTGWNHPLYSNIPALFWQKHNNTLLVRIRSGEPNAMLSPVILADATALQSLHQAKVFQQVTIAEWSMIACLIMAGFTFFIWLLRRRDRLYLHFSLLCMSWSVVMFYLAAPFAPFDHGTWLRFAYYCVDLSGFFLLMFLYYLMGLHRPLLKRIAIIAVIGSGVALFSMPMRHHVLVITVVHGIHLALVMYVLVIGAVRALRARSRELLWFMPGFLMIAALVLRDILAFWAAAQKPGGLPEGTYMQYGFAVLLILVFAYLIRTFVQALNNSEHLNEQLESRVRAVTVSLEQSYAENRALELRTTAQQERQKIYRDLHDDVGAKLVSIVYADASHRQVELAREALASLREAVSQESTSMRPLPVLLAGILTEMETRLDAAGIAFAQQGCDDVPDLPVDPAKAYHLSRILREVTTNVIKHVGQGAVALTCLCDDENLILEIIDQGPGIPDTATQQGTGLGNIRFRARELGALASWHNDTSGGTRFVLRLQLGQLMSVSKAG